MRVQRPGFWRRSPSRPAANSQVEGCADVQISSRRMALVGIRADNCDVFRFDWQSKACGRCDVLTHAGRTRGGAECITRIDRTLAHLCRELTATHEAPCSAWPFISTALKNSSTLTSSGDPWLNFFGSRLACMGFRTYSPSQAERTTCSGRAFALAHWRCSTFMV